MNEILKTAIVGTGKASHMHAQVLRGLQENNLVAVCSRGAEKAKEFAANYNIAAHTDIGEMIRKNKVQMVIVCTPHPYHKDATIQALEAGAHVLVEKPLASTLEDCDSMIEAANKTQKKLGVVSQRRFFPAARRCRQAIDEGKIGIPALGTITMLGWRDEAYYASDPWRGRWQTEGGGVLVNQAPHQLDLLLWLMNSEPAELFGIWKNFNHPYIEVEDTAVAILKFKNGAIANILVSNSQKPGIYGKVHVHGSNGASVGIQTDKGAMFIAGMSTMAAPQTNDLWNIPGEEEYLKRFEQDDASFFSQIDPIQFSIREQQLDFINAIINDRPPLVTANDGRKTVEVFSAIYESNKKNAVVKFNAL